MKRHSNNSEKIMIQVPKIAIPEVSLPAKEVVLINTGAEDVVEEPRY